MYTCGAPNIVTHWLLSLVSNTEEASQGDPARGVLCRTAASWVAMKSTPRPAARSIT